MFERQGDQIVGLKQEPKRYKMDASKNNRIMLDTAEKVIKRRAHQNCLDDITSLLQFSSKSGSAWGLLCHNSAIFRARSILSAFVVPKLTLLFTAEGWSA